MKTKMNNSLRLLINFLLLSVLGAFLLIIVPHFTNKNVIFVNINETQTKKINTKTEILKNEPILEKIIETKPEIKNTENIQVENKIVTHLIEVMGPPEPDSMNLINKDIKINESINTVENEQNEISNTKPEEEVLVLLGPPEPNDEQFKEMKIAETKAQLELEKGMFSELKAKPTPTYPKIVKSRRIKKKTKAQRALVNNNEYPELDSELVRNRYQKLNETGIKVQVVSSNPYVPFED